ncbi:hypothetical protein PENTCL1PPCAC_28277, partial [Pristionchus entomophagus]
FPSSYRRQEMRLLIVLGLLVLVASVKAKTKDRFPCVESDYPNRKGTNLERLDDGKDHCKKKLTIDQKDNFTMPFYYARSVRFNQLQRLHLIGGSVICEAEVEHAFIRLLYLYSCIFPAVQKLNGTSLENGHGKEFINFNDISQLDSEMQKVGRVEGLHQHRKGDEEKLREHLLNFISQLKHTNDRGHQGKPKVYRQFCSTDNRNQHVDTTNLMKIDENDSSFEDEI